MRWILYFHLLLPFQLCFKKIVRRGGPFGCSHIGMPSPRDVSGQTITDRLESASRHAGTFYYHFRVGLLCQVTPDTVGDMVDV
jgi:hypothetical protein